MEELYDISPYVYSMGKTVRNKYKIPHSVSSECCNVFIFVTKGNAVHQVDGRKRILEKGTMEIIPPYFHQVIYALGEEDTEIIYIYFDLFGKSNITKGIKKPSFNDISARELYFVDHPSCKNTGEYYDLVNSLTKKLELNLTKEDEISFLERKSIMLELLITFFKADEQKDTIAERSVFGHVARAVRYIENNVASPTLCSKEVAAYLGLNTEYLSKLFIKQIKTSLSGHIRMTRISRAKELFLIYKSVETVSAKCGFSTVQSFCRSFKTVVGVTPTEYMLSLEK